MQLANPIHRRVATGTKRPSAKPAHVASPEAIAEINAYIAVRDELFADAELIRTIAKLDSATSANDFVLNSLRLPRSPYQAQSLPEQDAKHERARCEFVRGRIAQLRMMSAPTPQMRAA
jgi:hypothetical protein